MRRINEITTTVSFEAAHFLPNVPEGHKCRNLHGHNYEVELTLEGDIDPKTGWVVDFGAVEDAWRPLFQQVDHKLLNDVEGLTNPTAEILANYILDRFSMKGATLVRVKVYETSKYTATVSVLR